MSESASATSGKSGGTPRGGKSGAGEKRGLFSRIALFIRQVLAELKKVVRPTRNELFTYFGVVIVFVLAVMLYIGLLDLGFGQIITWVFGT